MSGVTSFLTNQELVSQLSLRDDLTSMEHDLLDRLIRVTDEVDRLDKENTDLRWRLASAESPKQS